MSNPHHFERTLNLTSPLPTTLLVATLLMVLALGCNKSSEPDPAAESAPLGSAQQPPGAQQPPQGAPPQGAPPQAQGAPPQGAPQAMPQGGGAQVTDEQLETFAQAFSQAMAVQGELEKDLGSVESGEEAKALQQKAVVEMREKVKEAGMDFETYAGIAQKLRTDPQLQARLDEKLNALGGS